jgi:hypothetical protein
MRFAMHGRMACAVAAWALGLPASAQTVYRCGHEGRSYSQQPCSDGKPVRVDDARSDAERREAGHAAARDARIAHGLESERLAAPRVPSKPARIDGRGNPAVEPTPARQAAGRKRPKPLPRDDEFRAAVPKPAKPKSVASGN